MTDHPFHAQILNAAIDIAQTDGWRAVTRDRVAEQAYVAQGSVNAHFGTIDALRTAVMEEAVRREIVAIVAQGLAEQHPAARAAPVDLKRRALEQML